MYDAGCDAYGMSRCFGYVCMMNAYVMQILECFDESTVCLCRLHCLHEGLTEPMILLVLSLSAPEYGGRCSDDGLAEPMIVLVVSLSAPEYGGRCSDDGLAEPRNRVRPASAYEFLSGHVVRTAG